MPGCKQHGVVLSPIDVFQAAPSSIVVTGTATAGTRIIGSQCGAEAAGYILGTRCNLGSNVSIIVPASGNWIMNIPLQPAVGSSARTVLGATPVTMTQGCAGGSLCELHIFDFGTTTSPTNLNQAIGSKTIPVYINVN